MATAFGKIAPECDAQC